MNKKVGGLVIALIFLISFASAEIFFSTQPKNVYNLGDELAITLGSDGARGWAGVNLVCGNESKLIYYHYMAETDTSIDITLPLTTDSLRTMSGVCHLTATFNGAEKQGLNFEISKKIDITMTIEEQNYHPNNTISFSGSVSKPNGVLISGSVEVAIKNLGLSIVVPIQDNSFSGTLTLPENIASGAHELTAYVYEKDPSGEITNSGSYTTKINIIQEPRQLKLEISKTSIAPKETLEFSSTLYDQAGMTIDKKPVAFIIITSKGEEVVNILSETGATNYYTLRSNAPKGLWNISSESEAIQQKTQFFVTENKEALFELVNKTLIITNIGNVPYDKLVEIKIGNHSEVKDFNLSLGTSVQFPLYAPDGEYEISVSDGEKNITSKAMLTGNVISIGEPKKQISSMLNKGIFAWIFLIAILGTFIFLTSKRIISKKFPLGIGKWKLGNIGKDSDKPDFSKGGVVKIIAPEKPDNKGQVKVESASDEAHHTLVTNGAKQTASFVALKIKNFEELKKSKSNAFDNINDAIREISHNHGKIYRNEDSIIGIFAPAETKTFDNGLSAVMTAEAISKKLHEHNSKFVHRINFGIGVNIGDVAAKKEAGRLLFTPLGPGMSTAKKIAEISEKKVLLSEDIHKKLMSQVKVIPHGEHSGIKTYAIAEIVRKESNSKFIEDFLKRNQEYKQLRDFRVGK